MSATVSITDEEATRHAQRWAYWLTLANLPASAVADSRVWQPEHKELNDDERESLFAWARATLPTRYGRTRLRKTQALAAKLGIGDRASWKLCESAGAWL